MSSSSSPTASTLPAIVNGRLTAHTQDLITNALVDDSVSEFVPALNLARNATHPPFPVKVKRLLRAAVNHKAHKVLNYLLENEGAHTSTLSSFLIHENGSRELLEILIGHGWDVNQRDEEDGQRIIDWSCADGELVKWLVDHGATVDNEEEEETEDGAPRPPPLLETCSRFGSLSTFKYLQSKGARLSRRTLHLAARAGAFIGADPGKSFSKEEYRTGEDDVESSMEARKNLEDILRYLVDELRLNINDLDTDAPKDLSYCGTPVNYAAKEKRGAGVVAWLIGKGADPSLRSLGTDADGEGRMDAKGYAEWQGSLGVLEVLKSWNEDR